MLQASIMVSVHRQGKKVTHHKNCADGCEPFSYLEW